MADIVPIKQHAEYERHTKLSASVCLRNVRAMHPTEVLCIGLDSDGALFVHGSPPDPANSLWLMELAKATILGLR